VGSVVAVQAAGAKQLLRVLQLAHELIDRAGAAGITNCNTRFANVRQCPFHVRAGNRVDLVLVQATTQCGFSGAELAEQRLMFALHCC
jgi:hypothetical protein